jgi:hypothetical protein
MILAIMLAMQPQGAIPMHAGWELSGPTTRYESVRGAAAIRSNNGRAIRRDVRLQDGTIEFDVELVPFRTFVYLQFRMEKDNELEEIYLRTHKQGLPDAVQYNPVWNGDSFWQLWHGRDATGSPRFRFREWTHVRLVIQGTRAALFLDSATAPAMVATLARPPRDGYLALRVFTPDVESLGRETAASFANLVVRPGRVDYAFAQQAEPGFPAGTITRWQISPAFKGDTIAITVLTPAMLEKREQWPSYPVERTGIVAIGRHMPRPRPAGAAIARLLLRSRGERLQRLYLGYSDYATVWVNGRPIFSGDAHYSFDQPRQEGLIAQSQSTLWLPLRDGENEVLIAVVDGFGGWGLTGRLEPADGALLLSQTAATSSTAPRVSREPTPP